MSGSILIATIDINVCSRTINFYPSISMNDCKTEIILCSWKDCLWSFFLPKHVNCLLSGSAAARMQIWMFRYDFFKVLIDTANRCHSEIRLCGYLNRDRDLLTINRVALLCIGKNLAIRYRGCDTIYCDTVSKAIYWDISYFRNMIYF